MTDERSYINTLLHFNLEFVAGETNTYDRLLNEAFEPALDIFLDCPEWHADVEISGMHLAFCEQHFPWMVDKLRTLNQRGQVDVICVHYSETIWPAFPLEDFRRSWAIDRKIMDRCGLTFSPTFFAQENFFGEGVAAVASEFGIQHANIPEKNYFWPYHHLDPLYPVYNMQGLNLVIRADEHQDGKWWVYDDAARGLKIRWNYDKCGDGEPWVGDDPYVGGGLWKNDNKVQQKFAMYDEEQAIGTRFTTTHEFVQEMAALGIDKPSLLPVPDGPWGLEKPGVFQWMGQYFSFYELDVEMRSLEFRSRAMLLAGETLADVVEAQGGDITYYRYLLERGWQKQINSEVSDASGWVPTLIEMFYGIDNALNAFYLGERVIRDLRRVLGLSDEAIDTLSKQVLPKDAITLTGDEILPLEDWGFELIGPRQTQKCLQITPDIYRIEASFMHTEIDTGVKFAFKDPYNLSYSPALMDDVVVPHSLANYNPACMHLYLPLPNGLINLAPDWWVIKHNDCSHVACKVNLKDHKIEFMTLLTGMALAGREALDVELPQHWQFTLVHGSAEDALQWATRINLFPCVPADYPAWPKKPEPWIPFTRMVTK